VEEIAYLEIKYCKKGTFLAEVLGVFCDTKRSSSLNSDPHGGKKAEGRNQGYVNKPRVPGRGRGGEL